MLASWAKWLLGLRSSGASSQQRSRRSFETLERREMLTGLSDAAYTLLNERVAFNQDNFFVYQDADSGFNHGFPSNFFADPISLINQLTVDPAAIDDPLAPGGTTTNPDALDRARGTVFRVDIPAFGGPGQFAGVGFQEPENPTAGTRGYDLRDATHVLFEARTPTAGGLDVQFSVGGSNTDRLDLYTLTSTWQNLSVNLSDLRHPGTNLPAVPDLSDLSEMFAVVLSSDFEPGGGTVLLNDIRFVDMSSGQAVAPANPTEQPGGRPAPTLPLGNETFGAAPAVIHAADDGDPNFAVSGTWTLQSGFDPAYQDDQHSTFGAADGSATASWTFNNLEPRIYEIQATWVENPSNATNAPFALLDNALLRTTATVNQRLAPVGTEFDTTAGERLANQPRIWQTLGQVQVESGTLNVRLSNLAVDGNVVADGVRIVPTIPPDQAIRNLSTIYESALTVFALLDRGEAADLDSARLIADSIIYALQHDSTAQGSQLPTAPDGSRGLRDSYSSGDLAWYNSQGGGGSNQGESRLAGFSSDERLCGPSGYCLVLDGAFGGNNAFGIMALMSAYFEFGDSVYLDSAKEIGRWIHGNLVDPNGPAFGVNPADETFGGYFLGYPDQGVPKDRVNDLIRGKSIENNADIYSGFSMIAAAEQALGNGAEATTWMQRANIAGDFVMAMYDPGDAGDPRDGRFYTGTLFDGPDGLPRGPGLEPDGPQKGTDVANIAKVLDSNTFTVLALAQSPRYRTWIDGNGDPIDWREPVRHVLDTFRQQITATTGGETITYEGFNIVPSATTSQFRPGGPIDGLPDGIAWEFTAQVVVTAGFVEQLYGVSEFSAEREFFLDQLRLAQSSAPFGDGVGIVAATLDGENDNPNMGYAPLDQCLGTPFQCIAERVGLAATTWAVFAENEINIFTPQLPLPGAVGETLVVEDWNNKVTETDLGFNYFGGNMGEINEPPSDNEAMRITRTELSQDTPDAAGESLMIDIDFGRAPNPPGDFGGIFMSLFGLTDTLVSFDGTQVQQEFFPGYFLDFDDAFGGFEAFANRTIDEIAFDVKLGAVSQPFSLKVELKDEPFGPGPTDLFRLVDVNSTAWTTVRLTRSQFDDSLSGRGDTSAFNWNQVSNLAFIVERQLLDSSNGMPVGTNPSALQFFIDNVRLVDTDGATVDLEKASDPQTGDLLQFYEYAFLDYVRETSSRFFVDFASTGANSGGIIQDRSTFADLLSVGGVGFQLTSYVIDAERGYLSRPDAATLVFGVLNQLANGTQGAGPVGTIGYQGFFYHFLGHDGLRKQNFDRPETADLDESLNTVELSTIDTALAVAGALTAAEYFTGVTQVEADIRNLAHQIYAGVNWRFMLNSNPGSASPWDESNMMYLGWKPNEDRDGPAFQIPDDDGTGSFSGTPDDPAVVDFYTDEGLLIALLAMGSPNPEHRLPREVWDAMIRETDGDSFIKTFPGALFTYQFGSVWLDTEALGVDDHRATGGRGALPINFFENTRDAILATRDYSMANPNGRATWQNGGGELLFGVSAAEGPFDEYFAYGVPPAAQNENTGEFVVGPGMVMAEAESGTGDGSNRPRSNASGAVTVQLDAGESRDVSIDVPFDTEYDLVVRYSNDNFGPLESIEVRVDGDVVGSFSAQDTGNGGAGWNVFAESSPLGPVVLEPGSHQVTLSVSGGDGFGVEIDKVTLAHGNVLRPHEDGTVTVYGAGSAIKHAAEYALPSLWHAQQLGLLHPRFGFADAYNEQIADAVIREVPGGEILRTTGSWANFNGFGIDHGPMLIMIDNYLEDDFAPKLFMSNPYVATALNQVFALPDESLTLSIADAEITENNGLQATTATVTRNNSDNSAELLVALFNGDATEIDIPATVVIPANQNSVTFAVDAVDDNLLDGQQQALISASAAGLAPVGAFIDIADHETLTVSILDSAIPENGGTTTGTVFRSNIDDLANPLTVTMSSSDVTEATVDPNILVIPAASAFATFTIDAVDDGLFDGTRLVSISAAAGVGQDYIEISDQIQVVDAVGAIWQNPISPGDVDGDGDVDAPDLVELIKLIRRNAIPFILPAPTPAFQPPPFADVNGNGTLDVDDLREVIRIIRSGGSPEGEAEFVSAVDAIIAQMPTLISARSVGRHSISPDNSSGAGHASSFATFHFLEAAAQSHSRLGNHGLAPGKTEGKSEFVESRPRGARTQQRGSFGEEQNSPTTGRHAVDGNASVLNANAVDLILPIIDQEVLLMD